MGELLVLPVGFWERLEVGETCGVELPPNPGDSVEDMELDAVPVAACTVKVVVLVRVGSFPVGEEVPVRVGSKGVLVPFDRVGVGDDVPMEVLDTLGVPVLAKAREGEVVGDRDGEAEAE